MLNSSDYVIRNMQPGEERQLWQLFHETIRSVNLGDYTQAQVEAWSPEDRDMQVWSQRMQEIRPFVATHEDEILGYSDVQEDGLIDHLFVHHAWQGRGVATALMDEVERRADLMGLKHLHAHVSITARPLFTKRGFDVVRENRVEANGVTMTNFLMQRSLVS